MDVDVYQLSLRVTLAKFRLSHPPFPCIADWATFAGFSLPWGVSFTPVHRFTDWISFHWLARGSSTLPSFSHHVREFPHPLSRQCWWSQVWHYPSRMRTRLEGLIIENSEQETTFPIIKPIHPFIVRFHSSTDLLLCSSRFFRFSCSSASGVSFDLPEPTNLSLRWR